MILHTDDSLTVGELQEKFSECFPVLKIVFYTKPHGNKESSSVELEIEPALLLSAIRKNHTPGNLTISSNEKVSKVEGSFRKLFGLYVQIHYKVNGIWMQTNKTDNCSLQALCDQSYFTC